MAGDTVAPVPQQSGPDPVPSGRIVVERLTTPTGEWQLQARGGHYELICNGVFLMASYNRSSDLALATRALERIGGDQLRVLVGGLGVGYTAQAALADPRVDAVEVVEVEPVVVRWHRAYFAALTGLPLDDPRCRLRETDFFDMALLPDSVDAILLDTDNGPEWVARPVNERLYQEPMLYRLLTALSRRGVLAVWSANPAPQFARLLAAVAQGMEAIESTDEDGAGGTHPAWIYLAWRR